MKLYYECDNASETMQSMMEDGKAPVRRMRIVQKAVLTPCASQDKDASVTGIINITAIGSKPFAAGNRYALEISEAPSLDKATD